MLFVKTSNREPPEINNQSTTIISNKILDHRLNLFFIKESEYFVSKGIHKIDTIKGKNILKFDFHSARQQVFKIRSLHISCER